MLQEAGETPTYSIRLTWHMAGATLSSNLASPCFWLLQLRVFKTNPEGVVSVRFREAEPAQQCVQLMNGR